jgi:hypothetical protein
VHCSMEVGSRPATKPKKLRSAASRQLRVPIEPRVPALVYITVTQDLLQQANERFRAFAAHRLHVTEGCSHEVCQPAPQSPARLLP